MSNLFFNRFRRLSFVSVKTVPKKNLLILLGTVITIQALGQNQEKKADDSTRKHTLLLQVSTPIKHPSMAKYYNENWLISPLSQTGAPPDPDVRRNFSIGMNINYMYALSRTVRIGLKAGLGYRNIYENYYNHEKKAYPIQGSDTVYTYSDEKQELKYRQYNWHITPIVMYTEQWKRFVFSLGGGLSYVRIGKGKQVYEGSLSEGDSVDPSSHYYLGARSNYLIGGGNGIGVNAFLGVEYRFTPFISAGLQLDSYLHYLIMNENSLIKSETLGMDGTVLTSSEITEPNRYSQLSFSYIVPALNIKMRF